MVDAGLITASMVKKNRWFVQKPFETSYTKISPIKRYQPPRLSPEENEKTSRKVFTISKNYARDTGPVKPGSLYPEDTSRGALKMTKPEHLTQELQGLELFILKIPAVKHLKSPQQEHARQVL